MQHFPGVAREVSRFTYISQGGGKGVGRRVRRTRMNNKSHSDSGITASTAIS